MSSSQYLSFIGIDRRRRRNKGALPDRKAAQRTLLRALHQARPCWPHLGGIVFLTFLSTPIALLLPLPLKLVVDNVIGHQPAPAFLQGHLPASWTDSSTGLLMIAAGTLLVLGALMQVQILLNWTLQTYTGERIVHDFRAKLFWQVQRLRLEFHDRKGPSDTAYRIQHDAPAIQLVTIQGIVPMVTALFSFSGMAYVTSRMDWQLALIAFIISPALMLLSRAASRKVHDGWHKVKELDSSAMSVLTEVLGAVRLVKAFGRERDEDTRFVTRSENRLQGQLRLATLQAGYYCASAMLITVGTAATLWVGASHVQSGLLTLGELLIVMSYMTQLYEPLRTMTNKVSEMQSSLVSVERAFALLDESPEQLSSQGRSTSRVRGQMEFEHVSFVYDNGRKVLDDVSFEIEPGTKVGILGPTGSGKSTLVSLMTRFYECTEGRILLDGKDIRYYPLDELRKQFAIVPQEPVLFSTSVAENISYAQAEMDESAVLSAAHAANAHDFIARLQNGYKTVVGDRGSRLSGGERQRIAIARAFLKDSPILILDEPTSAVDLRTELAVMTATDNLMRGRTTFMIAHRLSTLEGCDMLLRFDQGRLQIIRDDVKGYLRQLAVTESMLQFEELVPVSSQTSNALQARAAVTSLN
jgi:ATP-binding cassette subfamily B protein